MPDDNCINRQMYDRRANDAQIGELINAVETLVHETRTNTRIVLYALCLLAGANSPLVVEVVKSLLKIV
jgi:hypothetical protein